MPTNVTTLDGGDGLSGSGGLGGGPVAISAKWIDVNWTFNSTYEPIIVGFDVVVYTGADPNDGTKYLIPVTRVNPSVRRLKISFTPKAAVTGAKAAVRAVYA